MNDIVTNAFGAMLVCFIGISIYLFLAFAISITFDIYYRIKERINKNMYDDLLEIINHFGVENQQRKLQEEIFELNEAITQYETLKDYIGHYQDMKDHILEELADCEILLSQLKINYGYDFNEFNNLKRKKVNRTLKRMKEGYYAKPKTNEE